MCVCEFAFTFTSNDLHLLTGTCFYSISFIAFLSFDLIPMAKKTVYQKSTNFYVYRVCCTYNLIQMRKKWICIYFVCFRALFKYSFSFIEINFDFYSKLGLKHPYLKILYVKEMMTSINLQINCSSNFGISSVP